MADWHAESGAGTRPEFGTSFRSTIVGDVVCNLPRRGTGGWWAPATESEDVGQSLSRDGVGEASEGAKWKTS